MCFEQREGRFDLGDGPEAAGGGDRVAALDRGTPRAVRSRAAQPFEDHVRGVGGGVRGDQIENDQGVLREVGGDLGCSVEGGFRDRTAPFIGGAPVGEVQQERDTGRVADELACPVWEMGECLIGRSDVSSWSCRASTARSACGVSRTVTGSGSA